MSYPVSKVRRAGRPRRRGAVMVIFAFAMILFLLMAMVAINVAYMELIRIQLRTATDFAAKAGARKLALTGDQAAAVHAALEVAASNRVAGRPLVLPESAVELGRAARTSDGHYNFEVDNTSPNACRVTASRSGVDAVDLPLTDKMFSPTQEAIAAQIDRDIALVLDRSGSMVYTDETTGAASGWRNGEAAPSTTRWYSVAVASKDFLNMLQNTPLDEKVSLVTFASTARLDHDLTFNYDQIRNSIDAITNRFIDGSTNISGGIDVGRQTLRDRGLHRGSAEQTIVIMTDGFHNTGTMTVRDAATIAAGQRITIHTITYGREADATTMRQVAEIGNGQYWHAPDRASLQAIFQRIADNSPTLLIK